MGHDRLELRGATAQELGGDSVDRDGSILGRQGSRCGGAGITGAKKQVRLEALSYLAKTRVGVHVRETDQGRRPRGACDWPK